MTLGTHKACEEKSNTNLGLQSAIYRSKTVFDHV